ncbi:MAG: TVP38/TMEM64 family protein [Clostridia bacterium]|nr:TVP38/TMEM64 family protein [Clostridia bacterium]
MFEKIVNKFRSVNYKALLIRALVITVIMGVFFVPIYFVFNAVDSNLWTALKSGNQEEMVRSIMKYDNHFGVIIVAILQVVQDLVIIIPSAPVHLVAGIILGTWKGFWVCHLADVATNMFVFFVYSKVKKYIDKFMPIDDSNSTVRLIKQGRSATYMIVMVCLLPAVPNGFIPYAAVNAGLALGKYTLAVTIGCAVPTLVMTAIGEQIYNADWLLMAFLIGISFIGVFVLLRYQHHILKMLELAKYKSTMFLTTEIPEHEIDDELRVKSNGRTPRRYKLSKRVMIPAELKYQEIPTSDVANPFGAFFSFKQTPPHPDNYEAEASEAKQPDGKGVGSADALPSDGEKRDDNTFAS